MHVRLKQARLDAGYPTATAAIGRFGWRSSAYRAHENGQNEFDVATAKVYAEAYGTTSGWLLLGEEVLMVGRGKSASTNFINRVTKDPIDVTKIPVRGRAVIGEWLEDFVRKKQGDEAPESPFPPDTNYPVESQFDLQVGGSCLNRLAQPGFYLRCIDLSLARIEVQDGDLVIVERRTKGGLSEISARRLRKLGDRFEFRCESDDPFWLGHVLIKDSTSGLGEDVSILAKVLWTYRKI